jgi:outer membrane protein
MNRRLFIIGISMLCLAGRALSGEQQISPEEVVDQALAYNLALKSLDQETKAADARLRQAKALGLPSIDAKGYASQYEGLEESSLGPNVTIPAIDTRYGASIGITQPLFTGGRILGQQAGAGFLKNASELYRQSSKADVALQALAAYWTWSKAYYSVMAFEAAVSWMEAHYADMLAQRKAGLVTENDTLSTEVGLDQTRLSLENARGNVRLALAQLAWLTGREWGPENAPQEATAPDEQIVEPASDSINAAMSNRLERTARRMEVQGAEEQIKVQRAGFYPQVNLMAQYEQARPNMMNIPPQDEWQDDAFVGVTASWNLLDWGLTRSKVAEAAARAEQAKIRAGQTDDGIRLEVRQSRIHLDVAMRRFQVARRAEESAQLNLKSATDLWKNGMARHSDVLDARSRLTEAEYEVIAARADVALNRAMLRKAMGELEVSSEK